MASFSSGSIEFRFDGSKLEIRDTVRNRSLRILSEDEVGQLTELLASRPAADPIPEETSNRRPTFRFPIPDNTRLRIVVSWSSRDLQVVPINISLTGVLVRLTEHADPEPQLDDLVTVTMSFAGDAPVQCRGIVRRKENRTFALLFPDSVDGEHLAPPKRLERMIMQVQREWLQSLRD